jgi:hypothetical protein
MCTEFDIWFFFVLLMQGLCPYNTVRIPTYINRYNVFQFMAIISLRGEVCAQTSILTTPLLIEV